MTEKELRALLPRDKHDHERLQTLFDIGLPVIAPVLPELFAWIKDMNWPVARPIAGFLASLGTAVMPQIRSVLATDDGMWKYWVLNAVVAHMPFEDKKVLQPVLEEFLANLTNDDRQNEADLAAQEILAQLS